jgi:hypothetical protein
VDAILNGNTIQLLPQEGAFSFIHDFESFIPSADTTIVGIENPTNFRWIRQQRHLFENIQPLFISRYPQTQYADVMEWLQSIPNPYLHFGDLDIAGIHIYLREYKKHLGERASFLVPAGLEQLLQQKGNRDLYNNQLHQLPDEGLITEQPIKEALQLMHRYKKGLEQEIFIDTTN